MPANGVVDRVRKKLILGGVALLVVVAALIAVAVVPSGGDDDDASGDDAAPETLAAGDADALAADLSSGKPARVAGSLVLPEGVRVDPEAAAALSSFQSIEIDQGTFVSTEAESGTVEASVVSAEGESETWDLLLQQSDGEWKIIASTASGGP